MTPRPPDGIVLKRDRDLDGRKNHIWLRRALFAAILLLPIAAAFNAFGQRPTTSTQETAAATLKVYSPARVRSGVVFQTRITLTAHRAIRRAVLRLDPGWLESMSINSIEPQPQDETSDNAGRTLLSLGPIERGGRFRLFIYFQTNPTNVGRRSQDMDLLDGNSVLAHVDRTITIFP